MAIKSQTKSILLKMMRNFNLKLQLKFKKQFLLGLLRHKTIAKGKLIDKAQLEILKMNKLLDRVRKTKILCFLITNNQ